MSRRGSCPEPEEDESRAAPGEEETPQNPLASPENLFPRKTLNFSQSSSFEKERKERLKRLCQPQNLFWDAQRRIPQFLVDKNPPVP